MDNSDLGRMILVAGQGGKSTLALALAADLGLPYIELDALSHLPGWVSRTRDDYFRVVRITIDENSDGWVIDGNDGGALDGMVPREAETVIYVNIGYWLMMWRLLLRSFVNAWTGRRICGENVETWGRLFSRRSILWFLLKRRNHINQVRGPRLREWAVNSRFIELRGRKALNRFYAERGLVRR